MDQIGSLLLMLVLAGLSVLMILIILLQRGRGGGLAGAFGGAGGQSALGNRAGDVFTKITIGMAVGWILLACVGNLYLAADAQRYVEAGVDDEPDDADADGVPTLSAGGGADFDAGTPAVTPVDPAPADLADPFAVPAETTGDDFPPPADADDADDADEDSTAGPALAPPALAPPAGAAADDEPTDDEPADGEPVTTPDPAPPTEPDTGAATGAGADRPSAALEAESGDGNGGGD